MEIDRMKFTLLQGAMTQQEFADKVGVTPLTIYNISKSGRCSRITFFKILKAFNIKPEEILA